MKEPLKDVCRRLSVNYLSGKTLLQVYDKEGRFEKKIGNEIPPCEEIKRTLLPILEDTLKNMGRKNCLNRMQNEKKLRDKNQLAHRRFRCRL